MSDLDFLSADQTQDVSSPDLSSSDASPQASDITVTQTNLVSDGFVPATVTDPNLINPWGVSYSPAGPFWVADNGTGMVTIYNGSGTPITVAGQAGITVAPPAGSLSSGEQASAATPTGMVFNGGGGFNITGVSGSGQSGSSLFLFATEDGTISGWNPAVDPVNTVLAVDNSGTGAVYKGLAIGSIGSDSFLYAANFNSGTVDVFDSNFNQVKSFTDPNLPSGYAPFDVQVLDGKLFVSFAVQDAAKHDDVAGVGNGVVDEFDLSGNLLATVASGGTLNSPWGLTLAPSSFGSLAGDLLVGNFGDGTINVYNPSTDQYLGQLLGTDGNPVVIGDLWSLIPGNGFSGGDPTLVYFTAGVQDEAHGLFGSLSAAPASTASVLPPPIDQTNPPASLIG